MRSVQFGVITPSQYDQVKPETKIVPDKDCRINNGVLGKTGRLYKKNEPCQIAIIKNKKDNFKPKNLQEALQNITIGLFPESILSKVTSFIPGTPIHFQEFVDNFSIVS